MVAGVDVQAGGALVDFGQASAGLYGNVMPIGVIILIRVVAVDVLEEGAAQGDV